MGCEMANSRKPNGSVRRINAYVYQKLPAVCSFCNHSVKQETYVKNGVLLKADIGTCRKCNRHYVSLTFYESHHNRVNCLNPEEVDKLVKKKQRKIEAKAARKIINRREIQDRKLKIYSRIVDSVNPEDGFDTDLFRALWFNCGLSLADMNSLFSAYIVKNQRGRSDCIFLFSNKQLLGVIGNRGLGINLANVESLQGRMLLSCSKYGYDYYFKDGTAGNNKNIIATFVYKA